MIDLVGVGLNATDTLIHVAEFPRCGSKVESHEVQVLPGGQVASAVIACQLWGLCTRYVGKLGDDSAGQLHRKEFGQAGVETHLISDSGCPSQQAFILVDPEGERTVLWRRDEKLALHPEELKREWVTNARALHVDGYDTAAATLAATWAREEGIPVFADIDDTYPGLEPLLEKIDFLIVSRDFPERLCGERELRKSLPVLQQKYGSRLTAATLGIGGVLARDGANFHHACAYRVPVADTTGAGDIFHAGFIYGLLQEWPLQRQLDFACAAAALNCSGPGARGGIQPVSVIESLMANGARYPVHGDL